MQIIFACEVKISLILEITLNINVFRYIHLRLSIKTFLLSWQITTPATAEHAHFMANVKRLPQRHIYACVFLAQRMSPLRCATVTTSLTRTNVNITTTSVRRKKNPVSSTMADVNVSPCLFYAAEYLTLKYQEFKESLCRIN